MLFNLFEGSIFEDHREEWLPGAAMGSLYNSEWRLPNQNGLKKPGQLFLLNFIFGFFVLF
jgi:hypothetical protein